MILKKIVEGWIFAAGFKLFELQFRLHIFCHSNKIYIYYCLSHLCGSNAHTFVSNGVVFTEIFTIYYASKSPAIIVFPVNFIYRFVRLDSAVLTHIFLF